MANHEDRLAHVHRRIDAAVRGIVTGAQWRHMLDVAAGFHTYSANKIGLIVVQCPDAAQVAGFHTRRLGWQVRRGERGIAILAPWSPVADR